MRPYVKIDAILNYVPGIIKENIDQVQIMSWAFDALRMTSLNWKYNYYVCFTEVKEHKAAIPQGIRGIAFALFTYYKPDDETMSSYLLETFNTTSEDCRLILTQEILYDGVFNRDALPMKYKGNSSDLVYNKYLDFYDKNCELGYTVNDLATCLTVDEKEGYVVMLYKQYAKEGNDFLIPDDIDLLIAIGKYVEAKYYGERAASLDQKAFNFYMQMLQMSQSMLIKASSKEILRRFNPDEYADINARRFFMQRLPEVSGIGRNKISV